MTGTFDLLVNNCNPQSTLHFQSQDGGIAFIQEGDEHQVLPHGSGRSGQSGGCGAGCSCMGPGQGRSATVQVQNNNNETHFNEEEGDSTSDNLEGTVNLYSSPDRAHVLLFNIPCDMATTWLLMDSCLSVNIITNRKWLHNIHKVIDRIPSTTPGAEPPRDAKDSGSARSNPTHLETSSSNRP